MKECRDKCAKQRERQVQRPNSGKQMMHSRYQEKARVEVSWRSRASMVRNRAEKAGRGRATQDH